MTLKTLTFSILIASSFLVPLNAQVLNQGAGTRKQGEMLVMFTMDHTRNTRSYDWSQNDWTDFSADKRDITRQFRLMLTYGITDRVEAMVYAPVYSKIKESGDMRDSATGLGDMILGLRVAVLKKIGFTALVSVKLPSGNTHAVPALGDGTTDPALGFIWSSPWVKSWKFHIKANHWWSGKSGLVRPGNTMNFQAKVDRKLSSRFKAIASYSLGTLSEKEIGGVISTQTDKIRHNLVVGGIYQAGRFFIRPKLYIPLAGEGGSLYTVKPMLDVWTVFKLR